MALPDQHLLVSGLGSIWTMPNTLLGLLAGLLTFQLPRMEDGIICFDRSPRGFTRFLLAINRSAMTLGEVVVSAEPVEGVVLVHEAAHVRQYRRWGPAFIPVYLALALVYGYRRHPFERAARRAAGEPD